jgi:hypothetical protein
MTVNHSLNDYMYKAAMYQRFANPYKHLASRLHYSNSPNQYWNSLEAKRWHSTPKPRNNDSNCPAMIKFLSFIPLNEYLEFYIDGVSLRNQISSISSKGYLPIASGLHHVNLSCHGEKPSQWNSHSLELSPGKFYTLAAVDSQGSIKPLIYEDPPGVPAGEAKIRIIHLWPEIKELDIAVKSRDVIFANVPFEKSTPYLGITPMSLELEARIAGSKETVKTFPALKFEQDTAYSIVLNEGEILLLKDLF